VRRLIAVLTATLAVTVTVTVAGCTAPVRTGSTGVDPGPTAGPTASPTAGPTATPVPRPPGNAPTRQFAVGVRQLDLNRGADRPLPTTVWYPANGTVPAGGRFPLVVLSHGLGGSPRAYAPIGTHWAAAGFIVAAPAYPYTKQGAKEFQVADVINQPADASQVITDVLALDAKPGDPFHGHIDTSAVAATGHSAGGYTTAGMLAGRRDERVRAAIIVAGGSVAGSFTGPATPVLFAHGDADETVPYDIGRRAYQTVPWPKAFLTLVGRGHLEYLAPGRGGFDQLLATTTDFLRWSLYGDAAAGGRLAADAAGGSTRWESTLQG
jgi:fermentation-respiration switch protein FrsA (DUF1100 family)